MEDIWLRKTVLSSGKGILGVKAMENEEKVEAFRLERSRQEENYMSAKPPLKGRLESIDKVVPRSKPSLRTPRKRHPLWHYGSQRVCFKPWEPTEELLDFCKSHLIRRGDAKHAMYSAANPCQHARGVS